MQIKMHETVRGKKPKSNRNSKGASTPKIARRKQKALNRLRKKLKT